MNGYEWMENIVDIDGFSNKGSAQLFELIALDCKEIHIKITYQAMHLSLADSAIFCLFRLFRSFFSCGWH